MHVQRQQIYTPEFRADAVALMRASDRTFRQLSEDLGVNHSTLRYWYRLANMNKRNAKGRPPLAARPATARAARRCRTG